MKQQAKQSFDKPSQIVFQVSSEVDVSARVHIGREESRSNYRCDALKHLSTANTWTAIICCSSWGFCRLYIIRFPLGNTAVSAIYALLQRKSQDTYENRLRAIVNRCSELQQEPDPLTVVIDFESDMMLALTAAVFGDHIAVHGCFYHLTQSTWRKVQDLGLVNQYKYSDAVKLFCGMIGSLALLPDGHEFLQENTPDGLESLLAYSDSTYCSGTYRRVRRQADNGQDVVVLRRSPPLFAPAMLNMHQVTPDGEQRSNNLCEAWNCRIEHLCGVSHPSVSKLLHWLKLS
ncbi:hypothetical protein LSH36_95g01012 [Paralvinella palmiformis]|uniref:MULE transposase domain-containing protein n=1 Tax=Paralvinella palmiformis TaxID=53620 RepID=A0AAD9K0J4_9ANNE|nr:hypothetical protein LSH36_95g01012 [Paralvinella palmiformis]